MNFAKEQDNRRTGRTTRLLEEVHTMLYDGPYKSIFFIVHHHDFARYCMQLLHKHTFVDALFEVSRQRVCFRNKKGELVTITFVVHDREWERTRGFRDPIARDHHVIELRTSPGLSDAERMHIELLSRAGLEPYTELYTFD